MLELIVGPAGSGKTTRVLERFRNLPEAERACSRLLVPTATMAEHLRNRLAREGIVFSPRLIMTLSRFAGEPLPAESPEVPRTVLPPRPPAAGLLLAIEHALSWHGLAGPPPWLAAFAEIAGAPGLARALARTIEELSSTGCPPAALPVKAPLDAAVRGVYEAAEREIVARGWALQGTRFHQAAAQILAAGAGEIATVFLDGFLSLTDPELEFIAALARHARVTVTLPRYSQTEFLQRRLEEVATSRISLESIRKSPSPEIVTAPSLEAEARTIANEVLAEVSAGRRFREIGIILRSPEVYLPVLQCVLERYRIPARFYFEPPLASQAAVGFLAGVFEAMLGGWDWEQTLAAIRASGLPCDAFDFEVRTRMPGRGLEGLLAAAGRDSEIGRLLIKLRGVDGWRAIREPAAAWARRAATLCSLWPTGAPREGLTHAGALAWRARQGAAGQFAGLLEEAAACFEPEEAVPAAQFWEAVRATLSVRTLSLPDHRREVVHVMSAYEARQWELPVVFVCGMLEKQFPRHHPQDPLLPDATRKLLKAAGYRLRTAADLDEEERFLFDLATTRATARLVLSYPSADSKGASTLPSVLLAGLGQPRAAEPGPLPGPIVPAQTRTGLRSPAVRAGLARRHAAFSPSSLEVFLRCPFQFFAGRTLRLKPAPPRPADRITPMMEGAIIHAALSAWQSGKSAIGPLFERVFAESCQACGALEGYLKESARLRLLQDLVQFTNDTRYHPGPGSLTEQSFEWKEDTGVTFKGRIDRVDIDPSGRAVVVDYKYSAPQRLRESVKKASLLQGPLYALACERVLGHEVRGVFYLGMRKDIVCAGWGEGLPKGAPFERAWLEERLGAALRAAGAVVGGENEPAPEDPDLCGFCDFRGVCRYV